MDGYINTDYRLYIDGNQHTVWSAERQIETKFDCRKNAIVGIIPTDAVFEKDIMCSIPLLCGRQTIQIKSFGFFLKEI